MTAVFLDSSAWLAAMDPRETNHEIARAQYAAASAVATFVTTSLVIAETHALIARRRGPGVGHEYLKDALGGAFRVVFCTAELLAAAVADWIVRFGDQRFSLCDAVSFEVMRRERLRRVLTRDRHFATAGFEVVS